MTPETKARQLIDQKLEQAGWVIQDMKQLNLGVAMGVAVREYSTDTDPADYVHEVFDESNQFSKKITYKVGKREAEESITNLPGANLVALQSAAKRGLPSH